MSDSKQLKLIWQVLDGFIDGRDLINIAALRFSGANPDIIGGDTDGTLSITADVATNKGGIIKLYGENHATLARDIEFYTDATLKLSYDESEGNWDFATENVIGIGSIACGVLTSSGAGRFVGVDTTLPGLIVTGVVGEQMKVRLDASDSTLLAHLQLIGNNVFDVTWYDDDETNPLFGFRGAQSTGTLVLRAWDAGTDTNGLKTVMTLTQAADGSGDVARIVWAGEHEFDDKVQLDDEVHMTGLPGGDPAVAGQLWNDGGIVTVSAG